MRGYASTGWPTTTSPPSGTCNASPGSRTASSPDGHASPCRACRPPPATSSSSASSSEEQPPVRDAAPTCTSQSVAWKCSPLPRRRCDPPTRSCSPASRRRNGRPSSPCCSGCSQQDRLACGAKQVGEADTRVELGADPVADHGDHLGSYPADRSCRAPLVAFVRTVCWHEAHRCSSSASSCAI